MAKKEKEEKEEKKEKKGKQTKDSGPKVFMNPKTDFGFKKVFGNERVLCGFLNALGVLPEKVAAIEYLSLEQLGIVEENRKAVYDIYVKTASGKRYIVEMQVSRQDHFEERMLFYASYSVIYQVAKGKTSTTNAAGETVARPSYEIDGVYVIAILDFVLFKEKKAANIVVEQVNLVRQEANVKFTDKYQFVTIELPKFRKTLEELVTLQDKFLYSLKHMDKLSERPAVMIEEVLQLLYGEAQIDKLTKRDMKTYDRSIVEYEDVRQAVDFARKEGLEAGERRGVRRGVRRGRKEGLEVGIEQGIVKGCHLANLSIQQIAALTGLTEERVYAILDS